MVRLAPGHPEIIDRGPRGRLFVDAGMVTPENGEALRERKHAAHNGVLNIALVLDRKGRIVAGPELTAVGLPGDEDYSLEEAPRRPVGDRPRGDGRDPARGPRPTTRRSAPWSAGG